MKWIQAIKNKYRTERNRYRKLKELHAQIKQIEGLISDIKDQSVTKSMKYPEGPKQANFYDLRGVRDVTDSIQDEPGA